MIHNNIILEDTTLRDGEQAPGIAFNKEMKIRIFDMLYEAGVRWFEVGIPAMGSEEISMMKELISRDLDAMLIAWNRGVMDDVKLSLDLGFKAVHIGLPASEIHIKNSLKKDYKWILKKAKDLVSYAKDRGAFVSISAEDIGRADLSYLQEYAAVVSEAGADRIRLSDTVGILSFDQYGEIVRKIKDVASADLQCHTHNDFGLATANTISGLMAGARYFHVTVNGIGERAGMPDILQVTSILKKIYNIDLGINFKKLIKVSDYVKHITNTDCFPWTPMIGKNIFSHESGIHVNGMINNKDTFEALSPDEFGKTTKYIIGKHSGRSTIDYYLRKEGYEPEKEELIKCLEMVRKCSIDNLGEVSVDELKDIYEIIHDR